MMARNLALGAGLAAMVAGACSTDPQYIQTRQFLEVGAPDTDITTASAQVIMPIRLEEAYELMERATLMNELGGINVPFVMLDDMSVSIEWTLKNLSADPGIARIEVNGGNEWFYYVPLNFVIDPDEDEEPPPLVGGIPIEVPGNATVTGVFREQELREAAVDLELITRGGVNPFAAILQSHDGVTEFMDPTTGMVIPEAAFAHLVQYDIILESDAHMILEFALRVRDHRGLLHELLLTAPDGERTLFTPAEYVPPALP